MSDARKTKSQLVLELEALRARVRSLELVSGRRDFFSERMLEAVVEQTAEGMAVSDLAGNLLFTNRSFAKMHGYEPEELQGLHLSVLHVPEQLSQVEEANRTLQETGRFRGEVWHARRDGTVFPTLMNNTLLRDETGKAVLMIGTLADITELKQTEQELRAFRDELEARVRKRTVQLAETNRELKNEIAQRKQEEAARVHLAAVLAASPDFVGTARENGRLLTINSAGRRLAGIDEDEDISDLRVADLHPEWAARIVQAEGIRTALERGTWQGETALRTRRGVIVPMSQVIVAHRNERGEVEFISTVMRDISGRVQAERALRASEERFRLVTLATRDGIYDWDIEHNRSWRNERYQALFGSSVLDPMTWWTDRLHPEERQDVVESLQRAFEKHRDRWAKEYQCRLQDGTYGHFLDRGFIIYDADGSPSRMIGAMTDVSRRRMAEDRVEEHRAALAHVGRLSTMGEMAAGLAHELNQPLSVILTYAQGALRRQQVGELDAQSLQGALTRVAEEATRAGEIIRRLRSLVRRRMTQRATAAINDLVREVLDLLAGELRQQQVSVRLELADTLPLIQVDVVQVQQVVLNLVRNALEAMGRTEVSSRKLTIRTAPLGPGKVEVVVIDRGSGFSPADYGKLFTPFFTTKPEGTGMGLPISKSIVEAHGGEISASSDPQQGTVLRFSLPVQSPITKETA